MNRGDNKELEAKLAVENAKKQVAEAINCLPNMFFTSDCTKSCRFKAKDCFWRTVLRCESGHGSHRFRRLKAQLLSK